MIQPPASLPVPWTFRADPPTRYWRNYELYQRRDGLIRIREDLDAFSHRGTNQGDIARFFFFCLAFDQIMKEGIDGDYVELGVYKGHTAKLLAGMARRSGRTAWLLDTFEGFDSSDLSGVDASHRMQFGDTSLDAVRAFIGEDHVQFVKGHFPDSASQMPEDKSFCLVHVDCDLYKPMSHALAYFYPKLAPGGYLIIHDYGSLEWNGAEQAVDEFFADKPEAVVMLPDGCTSAVIRKARTGKASNWLMKKRFALLGNEWTSAAKDVLRPILGDGWSGSENWGVWGIGQEHVLNIYMEEVPTDDLRIELDVGAALFDNRVEQLVDVMVGEECIARWDFALQKNRHVRSVVLPRRTIIRKDERLFHVTIEFRPKSVARVCDIDSSKDDTRALGMSLFRIRRGQVL